MPSFDPDSVQLDELLSRYIFDKGQYRISNLSVRYTAFMPRSDDLNLSVFRTSGLNDYAIWAIGDTVGQISNRKLQARGDIITTEVINQKLNVVPDNQPARHANIAGWPSEKYKRQEIAQILACKATLKLRLS